MHFRKNREVSSFSGRRLGGTGLLPAAGAYTILEIIAVIVVIGILVILATPRLDAFYLIKFQSAGRRLISDIRYVQNKAISRHSTTALDFRPAEERYLAFYCDRDDCNSNAAAWLPLQDAFTRQDLEVVYTSSDSQYRGVGITTASFNGTDMLRFDWEGAPQDASGNELSANGTVSLVYMGQTINATVTPVTGKINISSSF